MSYHTTLLAELGWLEKVVKARFQSQFGKNLFPAQAGEMRDAGLLPPPNTSGHGEFHRLVKDWGLAPEERLLLALGLAPHIRPDLLHALFMERANKAESSLVEAGGIIGHHFRGFLPTGLTFLFIVAGRETVRRLEALETLNASILLREKIMSFGPTYSGEPYLSGPLVLEQEWIERILFGGQPDRNPMLDITAVDKIAR